MFTSNLNIFALVHLGRVADIRSTPPHPRSTPEMSVCLWNAIYNHGQTINNGSIISVPVKVITMS
jgi:hypothetical protein